MIALRTAIAGTPGVACSKTKNGLRRVTPALVDQVIVGGWAEGVLGPSIQGRKSLVDVHSLESLEGLSVKPAATLSVEACHQGRGLA